MSVIASAAKQSPLSSTFDELNNEPNRCDCFVPCLMRNMLAMTDIRAEFTFLYLLVARKPHPLAPSPKERGD